MMFHTIAFIVGFLPVFLTGFFAIGRFCGAVWALYWLTASSLFFYAWWNPDYVVLLVGSVLLNYTIARRLRGADRPRVWLIAGVSLNLVILGWFKYADFLLHVVAPSAPALHITLPLAISFFTFQQIMFLVDASRGPIHMQPRNEDRLGRPSLAFRRSQPSQRAAANMANDAARFHHGLLQPVSLEPASGRSAEPRPFSPVPPFSTVPENAAFLGFSRAVGPAFDHPRVGWLQADGLNPIGDHHAATLLRPARCSAAAYPDTEAIVYTPEAPGIASVGLPKPADDRLPPLLPYAAFVTFFPHLIAGPIVRPSEIIPQLTDPDLGRLRMENIAEGLLIFLLGLGKKLVLADMFGGFADIGFDAAAHGTDLTFFEAWYATLSYALQIYFDFSGYSDMAIGLARMLNVWFPLNFDSPYQATDIAAFWRRWHITLGGFLRDYVYIPMGGNKAGTVRQIGNLMATMLLAGLWHGAAWNFVIWGGLHGLFLVIHALYRRLFRPLPARIGQALTLSVVILAWVPFRAASLSCTVTMLRGMIGLNGITLPRMIVSALPPLAAIADPVSVMRSLGDAHTLSFPELSACLLLGWLIVLTLPNIHRMSAAARQWTLTGSFALSVQALCFAPHVAPFLYFQF